jgi:hypothetical protein
LLLFFEMESKFHTTKKETAQQRYYASHKQEIKEKSQKKNQEKKQRQEREQQELRYRLWREDQERRFWLQEQEHRERRWREEQQRLWRREEELQDEAAVHNLSSIRIDYEEKKIIAHILLSIRTVLYEYYFNAIEDKLKTFKSNVSYRKKFNTEWSFHVGYTTQTRGISEFFDRPHPIQQPPWNGLGCDERNPLEKKVLKEGKNGVEKGELWVLATELMKLIDPEYVSKQYVVHFAKMSEFKNSIHLHTDEWDIGPQYIVHFGDFDGAELRVYNSREEKRTSDFFSVSKPRQIIYVDARFAHEVLIDNYSGDRYSMIVYQLWREDKLVPDPFLYPPRLVN